VWNSIVQGFAKINWMNWDMWAAIGQIIGAIATIWAVMVALKQTKIGLQQTQLSIKQMEEARRREKEIFLKEQEASMPEVKISADIIQEDNLEKVCIYLTNLKKEAPLYLNRHFLFPEAINRDNGYFGLILNSMNPNHIESDGQKKLQFGDVYKVKIPLAILIESIKPEKNALLTYQFYTTIDAAFICTIYIELVEEKDEDIIFKTWEVYFTPEGDSSVEEIKNIGDNIVSMDSKEQLEELKRFKEMGRDLIRS
jgi:hypothetical protein